jgi:hypothetical protein
LDTASLDATLDLQAASHRLVALCWRARDPQSKAHRTLQAAGFHVRFDFHTCPSPFG